MMFSSLELWVDSEKKWIAFMYVQNLLKYFRSFMYKPYSSTVDDSQQCSSVHSLSLLKKLAKELEGSPNELDRTSWCTWPSACHMSCAVVSLMSARWPS